MSRRIDKALQQITDRLYLYEAFRDNVLAFFNRHPELDGDPPIVHSLRNRIKSIDSLRNKIIRKSTKGNLITYRNVHERITDVAGVRVLHLYQQQFSLIHTCIQRHVDQGEWTYFETPKAYTWDPECEQFFRQYGLGVEIKESFYTSIHYVVKPRPDSPATCEIQVRTLFEEIWGEIDHLLNYPEKTNNVACKEQILVMARLVGAGSRLAESIFKTHNQD